MIAEQGAAAPAPADVWVGLGANLGEREEALRSALQRMAEWPDTRLVAVSALYASAPVDAGGPDYLNAVAHLHTTLAPLDVLQRLQAIEQDAGRERPYRNAPRTLDLDVLLYGSEVLSTPTLTVPHPRMNERAFVLLPLADLAPGLVSQAALDAVADQRITRLPQAWVADLL